MAHLTNARRGLRYSLAALLMGSCAPSALHAETSNAELAQEIAELKAQIRELRGAVTETRTETRRTSAKVRAVAERGPAYALPPPGPAMPYGAVPAFVTADKKLQFGSLVITPGGFVAMESRFSTRTQQADIGSNYAGNASAFGGIPFGPQGATNELRFTARQSRIAALVEAPITPNFLVSGYGEFDFLGSGATSNLNESNSYVPRIRHLYTTLDMGDSGLHVLAGQTWSLVTENSKGITPRNEVTPPSIDSQYVPGFVWKRQPQIRLTKDFDKRLWIAVSAESAQTTFGGNTGCTTGVNGTTVNGNGVTCDLGGNNNLNGTAVTNFSLNHIPDVVGKIAYEAQIADRDVHLEGFGIYRDLYDRVSFTPGLAANQDTTGYGFGGGLIVPLLPKKLDFQASGMYGRGIGSYGTAQFGDATFNAAGGLSAIPEFTALVGATAHVTPAIDVYAFGGIEQQQRDFFTTAAGAEVGVGATTANNTGCFNDSVVGTCAGNTHRIYQLTGGFWDKIYKGSFGEVRVGAQYSYTKRELFEGNGGGGTFYTPRTDDQSVLTSLRYYPFQAEAAPPPPVVAKY